MRWLALYLRCREVPAAAVALLGSLAATGVLAWLAGGPAVSAKLGVLGCALGPAAVAGTLCPPEPVLERGAGIAWPPRRLVHVLVAAVVVGGVLVAIHELVTHLGDPELLVRNVGGLMGLTALGVAVLGSRFAWLLPVGWGSIVAVTGPVTDPWPARVGTWLLQQPGTTTGTVTALVLGIVGATSYAVAGCRR